MDKVVNILIVLFIIVFDPLAICMVLVFNYLNKPEETANNVENLVIEPEQTYTNTTDVVDTPSDTPQISSESNSQTIELQSEPTDENLKRKPVISKAQAKAIQSYTGGIKV